MQWLSSERDVCYCRIYLIYFMPHAYNTICSIMHNIVHIWVENGGWHWHIYNLPHHIKNCIYSYMFVYNSIFGHPFVFHLFPHTHIIYIYIYMYVISVCRLMFSSPYAQIFVEIVAKKKRHQPSTIFNEHTPSLSLRILLNLYECRIQYLVIIIICGAGVYISTLFI